MTQPRPLAHGSAPHCHAMLLRLAGRLPDAVIAEARGHLVAGDMDSLAQAVVAAIVARGVRVRADDARMLGTLLSSAGIDAAPLAALTAHPRHTAAPLAWTFAPASPPMLAAHAARVGRCLDLTDERNRAIARHLIDDADAALIAMAAAEISGVVALWRAWRFAPESSTTVAPRRVYLAQVVGEANPSVVALRGQIALSEQGEADPQVEVFSAATTLPAYQQTARAWSALLWAASPTRSFQRAAVYDSADPAAGPRFHEGHPRISDIALRERLLAHLDSGIVIRATAQLRPDLVDPTRRAAVPWNFRTDGTWIWSDAIAYYLRVHALAPDTEFVKHISSAPATRPGPDSVTAFRAMAELYRRDSAR